MKTTIINGVEFCNFGSNNYTNGMELISCYPAPENIVKDVLDGKYPGVFLNPSAACGEEFFGLLGTEEQHKEVYVQQVDAQKARIAMRILGEWGTGFFGADSFMLLKANKLAEEQYKDWWKK